MRPATLGVARHEALRGTCSIASEMIGYQIDEIKHGAIDPASQSGIKVM
jgi:hypothetical protein